jgi:hypothetical protein
VVAPLASQSGITIQDASTVEAGTSGTNQIVFRVRVTRDTTVAAGQVSVQFQGSSGTATVATTQCGPGIDIVLQPSTLTILANTSEGEIRATVCEDPLDEPDSETFTVTLLSPFGASIQDGQATGTLLDDDPTPSLRVADVSAAEGNAGEQRNLTFTITLSAASGRPVSVNYGVASTGATQPAQGGAACGGTTDFVTRTGAETIPVGTTSRTVAVTLCGDGLFEPTERLIMTLSGPTNATIADGTGVGSISNDDAQPVATVIVPNDGNLTEGNAGPHVVTVRVTLSNPNHAGASVTFTLGGTAVRGTTCTGAVDVAAASNQVVANWPANTNTDANLQLTICGDTRDDDNDTIELTVTGGAVAAVAPGSQETRMVILDDDASPAISVTDVAVTEGEQAQVNVTLSAASNRDVDVLLSAAELSAAVARTLPDRLRGAIAPATAGPACGGDVDFVKTAHRIQIPAGATTAPTPLRVTTCRNADRDGPRSLTPSTTPEAFQVGASTPTNATIARATGVVAIQER